MFCYIKVENVLFSGLKMFYSIKVENVIFSGWKWLVAPPAFCMFSSC